MTQIPQNVEVVDLTKEIKISNSNAKFNKPLIPNVGWYKLPLFKKGNLVILNIIYYRDEANGLAILARDEHGYLKDFVFNLLSGVFYQLTPDGQTIDWKQYGYNETPGCAINYVVNSDFNLLGYSDDVTSFVYDEIVKMIAEIAEKEPAVATALKMVVRHIYGTYNDKYAKGQNIIDTKKMLYDPERGDFLNIYQVNRYLQRYLTQGSAKSHLIKDIEKAVHYLIFELTRRVMIGDVTEIEPKH